MSYLLLPKIEELTRPTRVITGSHRHITTRIPPSTAIQGRFQMNCLTTAPSNHSDHTHKHRSDAFNNWIESCYCVCVPHSHRGCERR